MNTILLLLAVLFGTVLIASTIMATRWSALRWSKLFFVPAFLSVTLLAVPIYYSALGHPRETIFSEAIGDKGTILGFRLVEDKAIYLWLLADGAVEPHYVALKWDRKLAEALIKAAQEASDKNGRVTYDQNPADDGTNGLKIYTNIPTGLPPKTVAPSRPLEY